MNTENIKTLGEILAPGLQEMGDVLWSFDMFAPNVPPRYSDDSFKVITDLFLSAVMDRMWVLQEKEGIESVDRVAMVAKCGKELRDIVKVYTDFSYGE